MNNLMAETPQSSTVRLSDGGLQEAGVENGWIVAGVAAADVADVQLPSRLRDAPTVSALYQLLSGQYEQILVMNPKTWDTYANSAPSALVDFIPDSESFAVLLPWKPPPRTSSRCDGVAESFLAGAGLLRRGALNAACFDPSRACFTLLLQIIAGSAMASRIRVCQVCARATETGLEDETTCIAVVPHRGQVAHVDACLRYLLRMPRKPSVKIGLDSADDAQLQTIAALYPEVDLYRVAEPPAGPYFVRNELIRRSADPWILFQDSDDIACENRLETLLSEAVARRYDIAGSHVLHVDEIGRSVTAIRYPLDVNAALDRAAWTPQLHPATLMRRSALETAGEFSTDCIFGNDTQFLLRAAFSLRIGNVDAFLYIRRSHSDSLTIRPESGLDSPLRQERRARWVKDFWSVRRGEIALRDSSLACRHAAPRPEMIGYPAVFALHRDGEGPPSSRQLA